MPRFMPDTSCMIPAVCTWHEHHEQAAREIERRLDNGEVLIVAVPAVVESYAVLTRLPTPHRISPADSLALLEGNFMTDTVELVTLRTDAYRDLLRSAPGRRIAGGRLYDAVIVACARAARVDALLTFNDRHFAPLAQQGPQIVVPVLRH
jgi:predicted nucleic acid-binding protein